MSVTVHFPEIVEQALAVFTPLFQNHTQRQDLGEYLTKLYFARGEISEIKAGPADAADRSFRNCRPTESSGKPKQFNEPRHPLSQTDQDNRHSKLGVIAIDGTPAASYVDASGKCHPLEFSRLRRREGCGTVGGEAGTHSAFFLELVDFCIRQDIPGTFVFDNRFTGAECLNPLHDRKRDYVCDVKFNRRIVWNGRDMAAGEMAASIPYGTRKLVELDGNKQWYFSRSTRILGLNHKVKVAILWNDRHDAAASKIFISNQLNWEVRRIVGAYTRGVLVLEKPQFQA